MLIFGLCFALLFIKLLCKKDSKYLPLCHCNLNSLATHDVAKVSAAKAFNASEKFDFICLSESYL